MLHICSISVLDQLNFDKSFDTSYISKLSYSGTVSESLQLDKDDKRCFFSQVFIKITHPGSTRGRLRGFNIGEDGGKSLYFFMLQNTCPCTGWFDPYPIPIF